MNIQLKPGVRAMQFVGANVAEVVAFVGSAGNVEHRFTPSGTQVFKVWWTKEIGMASHYRPGDWVIALPSGEFRGEDAESFAAMYEVAD